MTILDKYRNERDAHGDLTLLAIAIDAIEQGDCDCSHGDPPCVGCASYAALVEVVAQCEAARQEIAHLRALLLTALDDRDEARSVAAIMAHAYDSDTRPPNDTLAIARAWRLRARADGQS